MKSKEQLFIELIKDHRILISSSSFPNIIIFENSYDDWMFTYHKQTKKIEVSYYRAWMFFESKYFDQQKDIEYFMKEMFSKYFGFLDCEVCDKAYYPDSL